MRRARPFSAAVMLAAVMLAAVMLAAVVLAAWGALLSSPVSASDGSSPARHAIFVPPSNDACEDALEIGNGTFRGGTAGAGADGEASCAEPEPDVWFRYVAPADGPVRIRDRSGSVETTLSVHTGCPGNTDNEVTCHSSRSPTVTFEAVAGESYLVRASGGDLILDVEPVGAVAGTVTDEATGEPLGGVDVWSRNDQGHLVDYGTTDGSGRYLLGMASGAYFVTARLEGYLGELYDDLDCFGGFCDVTRGTAVEVTEGETARGIDFAMTFGGIVTGNVFDAATGEPLADVGVRVTDEEDALSFAVTDAAGDYSAGGLPGGSFFVITSNSQGYVDEIYDDVPCPGSSCDVATGTPVAVETGATVPGVDFGLDRLGAITGTVVDETDGAPIPAVMVLAWERGERTPAGSGRTGVSGTYSVGGLHPGEYFLTTRGFDHRDELYDDLPCLDGAFNGCDPAAGVPVEVLPDSTVAGIDFALTPLGVISGTVTDESSGKPIPGVTVSIWHVDGFGVTSARTGADGRYTTPGLAPGAYFASTSNTSGYLNEIFEEMPCPAGSTARPCDPFTGVFATPVAVGLAEVVSDVDFTLARAGGLTGTVTDEATGARISAVEVRVWDEAGRFVGLATTKTDGVYAVSGLTSGTYFVTTDTATRYFDEVYDDLPCPACDPTLGTPVGVTQGLITPGIDFALARLGSIAGTVTDRATGLPLESIGVTVWDSEGRFAGSVLTNAAGRYRVIRLLPGTYFATTVAPSSSGLRNELYDDLPCVPVPRFRPCDLSGGTPIPVELASITPGVDFALDVANGIEGVVTDEATGRPLPGVVIDVWGVRSSSPVRSSVTDGAGRYRVPLPPGVYFVSTYNERGALDEVYDDIACAGPAREGFCDALQGTPVEVVPDSVRGGVDFALAEAACVPGDTVLCLNGRRFRVEVSWEDPAGNAGAGHGAELTADSGYFWFFDADNVELVVKVLDACFDPFDRFWVFAAGLTDVAVTLTVTDTYTGEEQTYFNPPGAAFEPILDTAAFATCGAELATGATAVDVTAWRRFEAARSKSPVRLDAGSTGSTCSPNPIHLCLNEERFRVEVQWRTPSGRIGQGQAIPLTADTGTFWFFNSGNVEAIVKVLDACDLDPFHNYWVFAAGLTDVEATLRVTDTATGEVREYFNPLGSPFQPILDTEGFATCP